MSELFAVPFAMPQIVNIFLLGTSAITLIIICCTLALLQNLLTTILLMSVFSVLISICYLLMDAPDVAMTEVALGACLSTCVFLNLVKIFGEDPGKDASMLQKIFALLLCLGFAGVMIFACSHFPLYSQSNTPLQTYLTKYYLENTRIDIGIPSVVAAILASYRGYDTLGETIVILIAGLAVVLILARKKEV